MSHYYHAHTRCITAGWPNGILTWLGAEITRNDVTGKPLQRWPNESSYHYFSRWLHSRGLSLRWRMEDFPDAPEDKRILWRPIVNGLDLPACSVGFGSSTLDEYRAKEDACEALVDAYRCFQRSGF
ncbi:hypothetical protein ACGC1H_006187 [Rhizoctonia solani]|uniref:Uncharacterized protein n=1 Tax=Rhizoctonia solani TaxID=456999 RepID=A0A8H3GHN2_9AGAM|nr:unnamed protein product [Rhizoctonia solani]